MDRWYQDENLDVTQIKPVTFNNKVRPLDSRIGIVQLPPLHYSNPFETGSTPTPPTQTLGARTIHHEATAVLRPLLEGVRTSEDLSELLESLRDIR